MTQDEPMPEQVGRASVKIGPVDIEVVHLSDGRRLVTADSFAALLNWLSGPEEEASGAA